MSVRQPSGAGYVSHASTERAVPQGLVFMLWGNWAKQKGALIDKRRHHVLEAAHPSGLSASRVSQPVSQSHFPCQS